MKKDLNNDFQILQAEIDRLNKLIEHIKPYLIAAADGSMSRNNSEQLAADLIAEIEAGNE